MHVHCLTTSASDFHPFTTFRPSTSRLLNQINKAAQLPKNSEGRLFTPQLPSECGPLSLIVGSGNHHSLELAWRLHIAWPASPLGSQKTMRPPSSAHARNPLAQTRLKSTSSNNDAAIPTKLEVFSASADSSHGGPSHCYSPSWAEGRLSVEEIRRRFLSPPPLLPPLWPLPNRQASTLLLFVVLHPLFCCVQQHHLHPTIMPLSPR